MNFEQIHDCTECARHCGDAGSALRMLRNVRAGNFDAHTSGDPGNGQLGQCFLRIVSN